MAKQTFDPEVIRSFLADRRIATLPELKQRLGTASTMTVLRKLRALDYRSSYSHRGKFYTLGDIPDFDESGLWGHRGIWFSQYGNLVETAEVLVRQAEAGFSATELESLVHVECKRVLLALYRQERIHRQRLSGVYVYLAADPGKQRRQVLLRQEREAQVHMGASPANAIASHELKAAIILFFSLLDEKQRRLYAGLESHKLGHGGDRTMADLLELHVQTVARGRRELLGGDVDQKRTRQPGAGRKGTKKNARDLRSHSPDHEA